MHEIALDEEFTREVLLFAIWCFFIPEALRGRKSPALDLIRELSSRRT